MTVVGRQTAYRMRHCCARRIVETGGRRELLRTSTRWAERHPQGVCRIRKASEPPTAAQQRIIGAEANRIAVPTRLCRAQASPFRRHRSHSSPRLPINPFLLGVQGGIFSGNVKKCAVGKHPKSEKHGNTAQFSEVERSGTQENCGGIESGCRLRLRPLPVLRRRQSQRVARIDPNAVVVDKNIAENDRFDLFSR